MLMPSPVAVHMQARVCHHGRACPQQQHCWGHPHRTATATPPCCRALSSNSNGQQQAAKTDDVMLPQPPTSCTGSAVAEVDETHQFAFTTYLHSVDETSSLCDDVDTHLLSPQDVPAVTAAAHQLWSRIRVEATQITASEPLLEAFLYSSILQHETFPQALAFVLASSLACAMLPVEELMAMFSSVMKEDPSVLCGALGDVTAFYDRDPACTSYIQVLLHRKGYHGIQAQRIAHSLWVNNHKVVALALQSRMSEVYAVDIHPGAVLGRGLLLDHGTGVVIGETAVIGNNCSLMQNITLGGTGKESGDRHPKIMDNVLIGASSTILGNIVIGKGAQVGAGSLVLKPVAPHMMVVGSPSAVVGRVTGNPALRMQHYDDKFLKQDPFLDDHRPGTVTTAAGKKGR